jgi:hypothetical protein
MDNDPTALPAVMFGDLFSRDFDFSWHGSTTLKILGPKGRR